MPKVSVVIPVFKVEKYIGQCCRSLFGQTLDSMEFVFIDDCSPDDSIAVMQKVLEEYPHRKDQVKIIRHEVNQGVGAARNHGVAACTGDYIIHCDPDDWVDTDLYEKVWNAAAQSGADAVCLPFALEYTDSALCSEKHLPQPAPDAASYIRRNTGAHLNSLWTKLYKKEIAQGPSICVPDHFFLAEDLLRNIQMLDLCGNISYISGSFYHYRQNSASITHAFTGKHFLNLKGIARILRQSFPDKYTEVRLLLECSMFLAALRNMHKDPALLPLFTETWKETSFLNKLRLIFFPKNTLKGRIVLSTACISLPLTVFLLKRIFR